MNSKDPEYEAQQAARDLQADYPTAVVGVHELSVGEGAIAWCAIALVADGNERGDHSPTAVAQVYTTGDHRDAMMASARKTAEITARLAVSPYREHQ